MEKIGGGMCDYKEHMIIKQAPDPVHDFAFNPSDALQYKKWKNAMLDDKRSDVFNHTTTPIFAFREPLYCGVFGAFSNCESFPAWSSESQKSSGILHCHNLQLQMSLEENWWRSLYLQMKTTAKNATTMAKLMSVEIVTAELLCEWVQPPPRLIGSAIGAQVSYACSDVLRFVAEYEKQGGTDRLETGETGQFKLNAVSFPYMPNLFLFEIAPHYAHKSDAIGRNTTLFGPIVDEKKDVRICISHIELIVNTSNQAVPYKGTNSTQAIRINAYDLYKMTLENCFSMERFPYSFEEWMESACFVALTPGQLNGVLNSPSIRGNVTVQGTVYCKNMTRMAVNCGKGNIKWVDQEAKEGVIGPVGTNLTRYQCLVSGIYSNRQLTLDAKSGIVSENTFSEAFAQSLRLGTRAQ